MKRTGLLALSLVLMIILLCSCSSSAGVTSGSKEDGVFYIDTEGRHTEMPKSLPYSLKYNGKEITLDAVDVYEVRSSDYAHTLYVVSTIDAANLSDEEFHWLVAEDLETSAYITCEANEYDFRGAYLLGKLQDADSKQITVVYISSPSDHCRYSFADSEVSFSVKCTQEETFEKESKEGKAYKLHNINELTYRFTTPSDIPDAETIPDPLYSTIVNWLNKK